MDRILGVDYGTKRLGLAVTDPLGIAVLPLTAITYVSEKELLKNLGALVREKEVRRIVFGEPQGIDGIPGTHAAAVHRFAAICAETFSVPVDFFSEVMTSREAETILIEELGLSREKRKTLKDSLAAYLILKSYLDANGWPKK